MSSIAQVIQEPNEHTDDILTGAQAKSSSRLGRRSTRACQRCRDKKLKCQIAHSRSKCVACIKTRTDCIFDETPDGVPKGAEYVALLESRVALLEKELHSIHSRSREVTDAQISNDLNNSDFSTASATINGDGLERSNPRAAVTQAAHLPEYSFNDLMQSDMQNRDNVQNTTSNNTEINILQSGSSTSEVPVNTLPPLPSDSIADQLLERAYFYTQARYCIVDWTKVREWHNQRAEICYTTKQDDLEVQKRAYFVWIIYAIGAGLISNPEHPSKAYFARARRYIPAMLSNQDLTTVQGLLCLLQYVFRVTGGPSVWHVTGITLRLCIELDCHRKASKQEYGLNPRTMELRKRFFWCAYCFDRLVSSMSRRPFSVSDNDVDADIPVNIDVDCTDNEKIRHLQNKQRLGEENYRTEVTTMTAALLHLQMYQLKSQVITRFVGPHAQTPTYEDVKTNLDIIDDWKSKAIREYPSHIPHQPKEFICAMYFHTLLFVIRPALTQRAVEPDILGRCAKTSAEACENARVLNLDSQSAPSLVGLYQTFLCGISLLLCISIDPKTIPPRQALRAIIACSDTLAVYTRLYAGVSSFRELFEKLSDLFLGHFTSEDSEISSQMGHLRHFLEEVLSGAPADIPELLRSFSQRIFQASRMDSSTPSEHPFQPDFLMSEDFSTFLEFGDLVLPFETAIDVFPPFVSPS